MKRLLLILGILCLLVGFSPPINAQTYVQSQINTPYSSNPALTRPTLFYLPSDYLTSGKTYRLWIFYHGAGESLPGTPFGSTLYNSAQAGGPNPYLHNNTMPITFHDPITGEDFTYIFASPFSGNGWSTTGDESQYLKTYLVNNYRIDPARIVISGISAGGATTVEDCAYLNPNEDGLSVVPRSYKAACTVPMSEASNAIQTAWTDRAVPDSTRHWGHGNFADTHGSITYDWCIGYMNLSYKTTIYTLFHQYTETPAHGQWQLWFTPTYKMAMTFKGWDHINYTGSYSIYEWGAFSKRTGVSSSITANAGGNQTITLPVNAVTLTGAGNPSTGKTITGYAWAKTSGPASGTITSPSSASTTITGYTLAGTYVYQLTVSDNAPSSANSSVTITVNAATTVHPPPSVTASANQTITSSTTNITSVPSYTGTLASTIWTKFPFNQPGIKVGILGSSTWVGGGASTEDSSVLGRLETYWNSLGVISSVVNLANTGSDVGAALPTGTTPLGGLSSPDPIRNTNALIAAGGVKVCIIGFPTNGYNSATVTPTIVGQELQIIVNALNAAGIECYVNTSQPRNEFGTSDRAKLKVIRDTIMNRFGNHALDFWTGVTVPGGTSVIGQYAYSDSIHLNDLGHERLYEIVKAKNIFQNLVTKISTIATPTLSNTSITVADSGSRVYNVGIMDGDGLAASATTKVTVTVILPNCNGHKTVLNPDPTDSTVFIDGSTGYNPGDTILLNDNGKAFSNTVFVNMNGSSSCPIVIMNDPSLNRALRFRGPTTQIALGDCQHIKVTGSAIGSITYGVDMDSYPGPWTTANAGGGYFAYVTSGRSAYIEWDHLFTRHASIGFEVKQDGLCDTMYNYPNFVMDSIKIHDCKVVNTWDEGLYIGNTSPDNGPTSYDPRPVDCSGVTTYPRPIRIGAIHVYNVIVDSTGRGSIQLASGNGKGMEVDHCTVSHSGWSGDDAQGTGISFGTYTAPYIHDNIVRNTFTWGIAGLGGGITNTPIRIENNIVDSSGYMRYYIDPVAGTVGANILQWPVAIEITTKPVDSLPALDSTLVYVKTNKVGLFKNIDGYFMALDDTYFRMQRNGSIICGNTGLDGITPRTLLYNNNDNGATPINYSTNCGQIIIPPIYPHIVWPRKVRLVFKKGY